MLTFLELSYALTILCSFFLLLSFLLIPKPLPGIPYTCTSAYLPWGDLASLAVHNFLTGEVFDWFDLQSLKHNSPIVQVFLPNYSIKRPFVLVSDLRDCFATRRRL